MTENSRLVTSKRDAIIVARDPAEMQVAQQQLIAWAEHRLAECDAEIKDLEANYAVAHKAKWRAGPWKTRIAKEQRRRSFYEKVKAALDAGYCIVPNFPVEIFAVRTRREEPKSKAIETWRNENMKTESPPIGEGEYVSPQTIDDRWTEEETTSDGKTKNVAYRMPTEFQAPDFPFGFAKAQILDDTRAAMALKIFDDLGGLPARRKKQDPVIVGRLVFRDGGYSEKVITFLVSWFIDPRMI